MSSSELPSTARILIVDDERANAILLRDLLESAGVQTSICTDSTLAVAQTLEFDPHLILLDIMMPVIDGFEVCAQLKKNPELHHIPVLFLTAYSDMEVKIKAFEMGGADFITKPFHHGEVVSRVKVQLKLCFQQQELHDYAVKLEQLVEERTQQLIHSDRLVSLGTMAAKILHEINNPLTSVLGQIQLLKGYWTRVRSDASSIDEFADDIDESISEVYGSAQRIMGISDGLRQYARKGASAGGRQTHRLVDVVNSALRLVQPRVRTLMKFDIDIDEKLTICCDQQLMEQAFVNLISNSADALNKKEGALHLHAHLDDGMVRIDYQDTGPGIPPEIGERVFEPFFTTKDASQGTGLGMMIVQEIFRDHGGRIRLIPGEGGAHFHISLPSEDVEPDLTLAANVAQMPGASSAGLSH